MASQEDCKYCAQSTRHKTKVKATPMMQKDEVLEEINALLDAGLISSNTFQGERTVRPSAVPLRALQPSPCQLSAGLHPPRASTLSPTYP